MLAHAAVAATGPVLTPFQAFVLGAVQGLSELLPISSSAHLYLVPTLLHWPYAGVAFDVALHAGTLVALVGAFWKDWWNLAVDLFSFDPGKSREARQLLGMLVVATLPALMVGRVLGDLEERLRSIPLQASMLLVFGIVLWAADRFSKPGRDDRVPGWGPTIACGLFQCLALVPGVSRSGITLSAGRLTGLSRLAAARFSFMMSAPIVLAAVTYSSISKSDVLFHEMPTSTLLIGVASAAVFGVLAIRFMLGLLRSTGFGVFALYRVILALFLFWWSATHPAG